VPDLPRHAGRGKAELDINYSLDPSEREPGFILACQAKPVSERVVVDYDHG
jgi:ring-1,2-phenylacetyl-CoA epoxidase subunit PaaE